MGSHPDVDARYRPHAAFPNRGACRCRLSAGRRPHRGQLPPAFRPLRGQPRAAGRPILTQRLELAAAHAANYTLPELIDAPGLRYDRLDGEAEVLPELLIVPTPGAHPAGTSPGRAARRRRTVIVAAGQSHDTATAYGIPTESSRGAPPATGTRPAARDARLARPATATRPGPGRLRA